MIIAEVLISYAKSKISAAMVGIDVQFCWQHMAEFCVKCSSKYFLFSLWSSYIDMVELVQAFVRATRSANRSYHCATLRKNLPLEFFFLLITVHPCAKISPAVFADNHVHYVKYNVRAGDMFWRNARGVSDGIPSEQA